MSINSQLRNKLLAIAELSAVVGDQVFELDVPQRDDRTGEYKVPFVWFAQGSIDRVRCVDDLAGDKPFMITFDLEFVSKTVSEAVSIGAIVRDALELPGPQADFGGGPIKASLCEDHSDEYVKRNPAADSGLAVSSLVVLLYP